MPFQKLLSLVSIQAAFAEMFALVVPVLVIQESVKSFHKDIMRFFFVLYQHQVDSRYGSIFLAEPMHDNILPGLDFAFLAYLPVLQALESLRL